MKVSPQRMLKMVEPVSSSNISSSIKIGCWYFTMILLMDLSSKHILQEPSLLGTNNTRILQGVRLSLTCPFPNSSSIFFLNLLYVLKITSIGRSIGYGYTKDKIDLMLDPSEWWWWLSNLSKINFNSNNKLNYSSNEYGWIHKALRYNILLWLAIKIKRKRILFWNKNETIKQLKWISKK